MTAPSGTITGFAPVLTWEHNACANWYQVYLAKTEDPYTFIQWYETAGSSAGYPETACSNGTCSVTVDRTFSGGAYNWWVMGWNDQGGGEWSDSLEFTPQK